MNAEALLARLRDPDAALYFGVLLGLDRKVYLVAYAGMGESVASEFDAETQAEVRNLVQGGKIIIDRSRESSYPLMAYETRDGKVFEVHDGDYVTGHKLKLAEARK